MALLDTQEILKLNNKIKTFVLLSPWSTDINDANRFVVAPPPAVRDPTHCAAVESMTTICNTCRSALEYLSYYLETLNSGGKDAVEDLPAACLLHAGARTLQIGEEAECHLCVLLVSSLRAKRLAIESVGEGNIEMCWQAEQLNPPLIHFALVHNQHERSSDNYWNFLKLHSWPCPEFSSALSGAEVSSTIERHGSTGSEHSRDRAVQWLSRCQANADGKHDQCNQQPGDRLPTRLLDVKHALETSSLKLVTPHDNPDAFLPSKQYLTLSHCWGAWGSKEMPVLTTQNLSERQTHGMDISLLPQTFKDALQIAHWFHVRWLWIDSLCIVQDSREDWEHEAVLMYSVYKNALLNISADDSNDARWGCFRERDPLSVCPMRLELPGLGNWTNWLTPDSNAISEAINGAPLAKRSWVFQERQLSRRVLHFTSSELIWECCAEAPYFACETFPEGAPFKAFFNKKPKFQSQSNLGTSDPAELYKTWNTLCEAYSEKLLSHGSDKAVALSGLAQEFQAAIPNDTYVAGLWRSTLPESLLWKSSDHCGHFEASGYIAPTWSWLSIDGAVSQHVSGNTAHSLVDITSVATDPVVKSQPTASLRSASVDLLCYLRPVEIRPDYEKKPWYMLAMGGGKMHKLIVKDGGEEVADMESSFSFSFDIPFDDQSGPASVTGYFLPVCVEQPTEQSEKVIRGLLVEPTSDEPNCFRRIGIMSVKGYPCLSIGYKLKNRQQDGESNAGESRQSWLALRELLKPTYQEPRKPSQDTEAAEKGTSAQSPISDDSGSQASDSRAADDRKADDESVESTREPENHIKATETDLEGGAIESKAPETEKAETRPDLDKTDNDPVEYLQPRVDLDAINAVDRMYAMDSAFISSELEGQFEWLVPQQIRLV